MAKACCEEMAEFLKTVEKAYGVKWIKEEGEPSEMLVETARSTLPNIIFRFCPYCGSPIGESKIDETNPIVKKLSDIVFNKEIDEAQSLSSRSVVLEETISELRKLLKAGGPLIR